MISSPIELLEEYPHSQGTLRVYMKRDDLVYGACQGNKFRKMRYHLAEAIRRGKHHLLSFGGAYSNHLFALAYLGRESGWPTIGLVRGELHDDNPSLAAMRRWGMHLVAIDRETYRRRYDLDYLHEVEETYPKAYLIPEGGGQRPGMLGMHDLVREVHDQTDIHFDLWACPFATGATAAGIAQALGPEEQLWAFAVLKGLNHQAMLDAYQLDADVQSRIRIFEAHAGGFARRSPEIEALIARYQQKKNILLDPIYTGKMMHALLQHLQSELPAGDRNLLVLHTGGLQGNAGYNQRFSTDLPAPYFF